MKKRFIAALIIVGFSGIVAQVLLLRELLIKFYGNELSIGIILANWLILEAAGAFFVGKRIEHIKRKIETFIILQLIFCLSLPLVVYLTRVLNIIFGLTPGEGLGIVPIFCSSFILLLPISIPHGALFTFGCRIYSSFQGSDVSVEGIKGKPSLGGGVIGKVYVYEAFGTLIGGIVFTYLLIRYFNSFQITFGISLLNILICLILLGASYKPDRLLLTKLLGYITCIFLFLNIFLILKADNIHRDSLKKQWPQHKVIYYRNSVYGNVAVTERGKQYTFFSNGIPMFSSPTPDIFFVEEFAHLPLLSHPSPKTILIISGGAGGLINEVLKHPVEEIDYCELDPLIIKAAKRFSAPITRKELSDPRVKIHYVDGRYFLKDTKNRYDVIMIGIPNPQDLQTNRLFTEEFFSMAKNRLNENGILAINLPGSLSYLSYELRKLNACIHDALKINFPYIRTIPGDTNILLSSASGNLSAINPALLTRRFKQRGFGASLITQNYIEYKLAPGRLKWYLESIKEAKRKANKDFSPIGVFYSLSFWNALFSPHTQGIFKLFEKISLKFFIIPVIIFVILYLIISFKNKGVGRYAVPYAIIATGFCGMLFDLILIFAFQILYGFVYYWMGLLITAFMVGLTLGGLAMTLSLEKIKDDLKSFIRLEIALIFFSFILLFTLLRLNVPFRQITFLALSFISGFLVGAEFPLGNKIYLKTSPNIGQAAGLLYAGDLLGGWIGGMLGGVALLPILGLFNSCMLMVVLKMSSFIILMFTRREGAIA
ncbi:MAG: spermine synthase [Candidatus Omnitrophota bacterium]|nr:MAG: spermine synthase [Candidatus Omnitrophota bacterium]